MTDHEDTEAEATEPENMAELVEDVEESLSGDRFDGEPLAVAGVVVAQSGEYHEIFAVQDPDEFDYSTVGDADYTAASTQAAVAKALLNLAMENGANPLEAMIGGSDFEIVEPGDVVGREETDDDPDGDGMEGMFE